MKDIIKALIVGWSIVWAMCILSFTIFQGGQLIMMFVFAQAPWSIPVSFAAIWLVVSLLIVAIPYALCSVLCKKKPEASSKPEALPKEEAAAE